MKRKLVVENVFVLMLAFSVVTGLFSHAFAVVEKTGQPRIDEAFMKVITNPDAATTAFQSCEVEFLPDMIKWTNIQKLITENQIIIANPGYHYCHIDFNCRSYVPSDYNQSDAGRPLAPLNWTSFRQALAWVGLSHAEKEAAILQIFGGPLVTAVDSPVPSALGMWHYEPPEYPGCNYQYAWELMQASGFYVSGSLLYQPNGVVVRNELGILSPAEAPTSVAFTQKWVDKWNDFFDNYLGVTNCNFVNAATPFVTMVNTVFSYRSFDAYFLCHGLGRFPDYLYDFFHSSQDYPWSDNPTGLQDPALDHDLEVIRWSLNETEQLAHCYDAQRLLIFEDCPTVSVYSRTYFTAFKNYTYYNSTDARFLVGMENQKGVGADNRWTWGLMHWSDTSGGTIKYVLGGNLTRLHPGWANSAYEWDCLNRVFSGLLATDLNMADLPNVACSWRTEPFVWEPYGIHDGSRVRFQIRSDVLWHDLHPVDIKDVKFALDFIRTLPRYQPIYRHLLFSQIVDPYTIDCYMDISSRYIVYDLASVALLFPEHIYGTTFTAYHDFAGGEVTYVYPEGWLKQHGYDPITCSPDNIDYSVGEARKVLFGCGPYVFDYWNPQASIAHLVKFNHYWISAPVKASIITPHRADPDTQFEYQVQIVNEGSKDPTSPGETVPFAIDRVDVTVDDQVVLTIPGPIVVSPFSCWKSVFHTLSLPAGKHFIGVRVYGYGDPNPYESHSCPVWATIKQDVTLDFYVGIDDVFASACAFGSQPPPFPGHQRWDERCDINDDYYIGIDDIFRIAMLFDWGWMN